MVPRHAGAKLICDVVAQLWMIAANRVSGAGAAPESHARAAMHIAIHPERWVLKAPQQVSLSRLGAIAGHALSVAYEAFGKMTSLARSARVETRKPALGSTHFSDFVGSVRSPERSDYAFTKNDCTPLPYLG